VRCSADAIGLDMARSEGQTCEREVYHAKGTFCFCFGSKKDFWRVDIEMEWSADTAGVDAMDDATKLVLIGCCSDPLMSQITWRMRLGSSDVGGRDALNAEMDLHPSGLLNGC